MNAFSVPAADWRIDAGLVQRLLGEQHPDLASLPIEPLASGWDNALFRVGSQLVARLPRRALAVGLLMKEQRWLPELASRVPIPIPAPVRSGTPTGLYPAPWTLSPWLHGVAADEQALRADQAEKLALFLKALHVPAPPDLPRNPTRGVPLAERAGAIEERFERLKHKTRLLTPAIRSLWRDAVQAPPDTRDTWLHGDLHARNVLVDRGRLSAVIDWGDLCRGDRATDLAALWMLLPNARAREAAMSAYGPAPEGTWLRARGWAVLFGTVLLEAGLGEHPGYAVMGEQTLRQLGEDPRS